MLLVYTLLVTVIQRALKQFYATQKIKDDTVGVFFYIVCHI